MLDFVFVLRTSAIKTSFMALGLSSVASAWPNAAKIRTKFKSRRNEGDDFIKAAFGLESMINLS